jgi:hypothetical protein
MLIIGIILSFVGLVYLCWLLFALAVYALPLFAGAAAGIAAYHSSSGPMVAIFVGATAGAITLIAGQIAFTTSRAFPIRLAIALLFAVPAAVAGYHAAYGLSSIAVPAEIWRQVMGVVGAMIVAAAAWARLAFSAPSGDGQGAAVGSASDRLPSATRLKARPVLFRVGWRADR